eukprot:2023774-Prymnesium_polylepis.1
MDIWFDDHYARGHGRTRPHDVMMEILTLLRDDIAYVTVSQQDEGIFQAMRALGPSWTYRDRQHKEMVRILSSILVLSSGGNGHVPLPLLKQEEALLPPSDVAATDAPMSDPSTSRNAPPILTHVTRVETGIRTLRYALRYELLNSSAVNSSERRQRIEYVHGGNWRERAARSAYVLTPRGGGRSAFIVYEVLQLGLLPVYVWDDSEWVPYRGTRADLTRFGFSVRLGEFRHRLDEVFAAATPIEVARRRKVVRELRESHFTYAGVLDQITRLFLHGTSSGPLASDLRCQSRAPLGGPQCPEWHVLDQFHSGFHPCAPLWLPGWASTQFALEQRYPWLSYSAPLFTKRSHGHRFSDGELETMLRLPNLVAPAAQVLDEARAAAFVAWCRQSHACPATP